MNSFVIGKSILSGQAGNAGPTAAGADERTPVLGRKLPLGAARPTYYVLYNTYIPVYYGLVLGITPSSSILKVVIARRQSLPIPL